MINALNKLLSNNDLRNKAGVLASQFGMAFAKQLYEQLRTEHTDMKSQYGKRGKGSSSSSTSTSTTTGT